jgi:hypothetical protein
MFVVRPSGGSLYLTLHCERSFNVLAKFMPLPGTVNVVIQPLAKVFAQPQTT